MSMFRMALRLMVVFAVLLVLASCGSGGGREVGLDTKDSSDWPPVIKANVLGFEAGSYQGNIPNVAVSVQDSLTGAAITTATVTFNEAPLAYNADPDHEAYEGTMAIPPGDSILLKVTVNDQTYSVSTTQFTSYPTITSSDGDIWYPGIFNSVNWSAGAPVADAVHNLAILDAQNPFGVMVWPTSEATYRVMPTSVTSFRFPENSVSAGERLVLTAIVKGVIIPGAAGGSGVLVAGCSTKRITVRDAKLTSLTLSPLNAILAWGTDRQFTATATFSDNSTLDVTDKVQWGANNFAVDMSSSTPGLARGGYAGVSNVYAYLNDITATTTATVLQPRLLSLVVTPSSRTMVPGTVQHFRATGRYEDGSERDITSSVAWNSSRPAMATVMSGSESSGQVTALAVGSTVVTARAEGLSESAAVTVADPPSVTGTSVYLQSDTGDYIGQGAISSFTQANSQISVGAFGGRLTVSVTGAETWSQANFVLPSSLSRFEAGYFGNLTRYPFHNPAVGGMEWDKDHRGCNTLSGSFTVDRVTYSGATLTAIDIHFEQHCENQSPALYGWLHWER